MLGVRGRARRELRARLGAAQRRLPPPARAELHERPGGASDAAQLGGWGGVAAAGSPLDLRCRKTLRERSATARFRLSRGKAQTLGSYTDISFGQ